MKKLYLSILLAAISFAFPFKTFADTTCQAIYGGGQTCVTTTNISINKTVMNPQTGAMVDNLGINDPLYKPGFIATFQIAVTNTSGSNISRISVKDIFPQYVTFSSGPGSFDNNSQTLTFEVDNLASNETRTFTILGRIVNISLLPINQGGVVCVINQATATNIDNSSQTSQDNAQLCIEKSVTSSFPNFSNTTLKTTPSTGAESLTLLSLVPTSIAGLLLRKKSTRMISNKGMK